MDTVFPIGHYLGPFHRAHGTPPQHYVVRVGWQIRKLPDEAHRDVWLLAHGASAPPASPWTRAEIAAAAARTVGVAHGHDIIETLLNMDLLAAVDPDTDDAVDFARRHRIQPLLVGLGNTPDDVGSDGIGLPGLPPLLTVRPREFEIWQWGHLWPSIWSACEGLARATRDSGGADATRTQPAQVLAFLLGAMRTLVARNAMYVDVTNDAAG